MKSSKSLNTSIVSALVCCAFLGCAGPKNPPVTGEPKWSSRATERLARRACFDCHSNETRWPIYAGLPFVANMISGHVRDGRRALNFSEWDQKQGELDDLGEVISGGEMPLADYVMMHPDARLSSDEKKTLSRGLRDTVAADPPGR
jgi:hypothetical protein